MEDRFQKALLLSEELLEDIEMERISVASIALRCMRLARLINDTDAMKWLGFEISGYSFQTQNMLEKDAFEVAWSHGRKVVTEKPEEKHVFVDLADELEASIAANQIALQSLKSEGVSVSGEWAAVAMSNFTSAVTGSISSLTTSIKAAKHKVSIIRGKYHHYVLSVNYELKFSGRVEEIFKDYRSRVDSEIIKIVPDSIKKLDAIYSGLSSENSESWSQAITTCRRFFEDFSNAMFSKLMPECSEEKYITHSGKELIISGDKYLNRIYSILDIIIGSSPEDSIVGSHFLYIIDWIDKLNDSLCKGVHTEITYQEALRTVLHTYICFGDISSMCKS